MTVELPVNITNPLHDEIMKYQFTKPRYKLKFPGLAGKVCIANFKQNELSFCDACLSQQRRSTTFMFLDLTLELVLT